MKRVCAAMLMAALVTAMAITASARNCPKSSVSSTSCRMAAGHFCTKTHTSDGVSEYLVSRRFGNEKKGHGFAQLFEHMMFQGWNMHLTVRLTG